MGEVPELAGQEDPAHGLRKLDETPAGRLVRCVDLVTHVMRRDGLWLAEAVGHVVQALSSVGDGLELFHLRRGALPAYAAPWEPVRWRWSDPGRWNLGDTVPEGYRVRHFTPFDFDERQYTDGMGRVSVPAHLLGHRLEWHGHGVEPMHTQTVADWLAILGNQWQARVGLGSLDRGRGEPSSVAVRSSAARAAGLLGTAEVLALPVATVAPVAEPAGRCVKRAEMIRANRNEWPSIETDLKNSGVNGLSETAKADGRGWWHEERAREWARSRGKLSEPVRQVLRALSGR